MDDQSDGVLVLAMFSTVMFNPRFWNTKIKIAILTAATFAAMC